jgi:rRNA maturation endonuclease Nob1
MKKIERFFVLRCRDCEISYRIYYIRIKSPQELKKCENCGSTNVEIRK